MSESLLTEFAVMACLAEENFLKNVLTWNKGAAQRFQVGTRIPLMLTTTTTTTVIMYFGKTILLMF
jgi:hypothetical protein